MLNVKLIRHNAAGVDLPDDPSFPFVMHAEFRPPSFMDVTFVMIHGGSEIIRVRGKTREDIVEFTKKNDLARHIRLRTLTITEEVGGQRNVLIEVAPGQDKLPVAELLQD